MEGIVEYLERHQHLHWFWGAKQAGVQLQADIASVLVKT